jgi:hypothetical protein
MSELKLRPPRLSTFFRRLLEACPEGRGKQIPCCARDDKVRGCGACVARLAFLPQSVKPRYSARAAVVSLQVGEDDLTQRLALLANFLRVIPEGPD